MAKWQEKEKRSYWGSVGKGKLKGTFMFYWLTDADLNPYMSLNTQ